MNDDIARRLPGDRPIPPTPPDDVPYRFDRSHAVRDIVEAFEGLEAGVETETVVSVAGRLMLRRDQGRLAFGTLQDATGRIQLFATAAASEEFERFTALSIGDWIGVRGAVMATSARRAVGEGRRLDAAGPGPGDRSPTSGTASPTPTPATDSATWTCG